MAELRRFTNATETVVKVSLIARTGDGHEGTTIPVVSTPFLLGRSAVCQFRFSSPLVSEFQCVIFVSVREGKVFVRDQEDTTGTFLNDRRVTTSLQEARHGDRLQLGPFVFEFCIEQTSANAGASRMNLVPPGWATAESDSEQELTY